MPKATTCKLADGSSASRKQYDCATKPRGGASHIRSSVAVNATSSSGHIRKARRDRQRISSIESGTRDAPREHRSASRSRIA